MDWVKKLGIKHFSGIYSRDSLPHAIRKECGIINLDDIQGPGTHWVCYRNLDNSCGHTTDFYLGKPFLPRANSSKIYLGKFISGFVLPR